jgi:tRNA A-37 threonylcarbamoyl transferase component Bud32
MTLDEARRRVESDPDFINIKRFDFSLAKCLEKYENKPDGVPLRIIAQALVMTEEEVEETLQNIIGKLREEMKVEE